MHLAVDMSGSGGFQACMFVFFPVIPPFPSHNCDMIKGNESDVGNIDFELQPRARGTFFEVGVLKKVRV